jgi:isopentenyl-diphosphate delta-isomerase
MLLQQRSATKYHSPDKWTNACCSHPRENETYLDGAKRRIHEELGINCELEEKFHFIYKADVGQDLWEHELDHVFIGTYNGEYQLNPDEVSAIRFVTMEELDEEIANKPELFTEWFKIIWDEYRHHL